ncbi:ATP-dependent DNA helicase pif1-like [Diorhabda sublineata]|uniref:ATP-dependent DNA helicase pif1-like n=1 Tax=Diorhabda sublineata TaxID=1163346 RepID=UPI0024E0DE4F|nr:ATP-dependent DNA helicase pif1-like [Diorhabda sublineata]
MKPWPGWPLESEQSLAILNEVALIVWDESPMTPKLAIEAVDRYLKDLSKSSLPMVGKCCLFGGDFRQTLPVIIGGHKKDIVNACLKRSVLWSSFRTFHLSINMRARHYVENCEELGNRTFAEWLLNLGDGKIQYVTLHPNSTISGILPDDLIEIPHMLRVSNIDQLIDFVYGNDFSSIENGTRAILCPTNAAVNDINEMILDRMLEIEVKVYYSVDEYKREEDDDFHVTTDLLNSINCAALPPHELKLKIGAIVMLLRNIDIEDGLCNGTRVRIISLGDHIIECEILTGVNIGRKVLLPRIRMISRDTMLPKDMIRTQFPIRLAYGITINKSQGQSLTKAGVYLNGPCFTHGQLYVAFSRVGSADNVRILVNEGNQQGDDLVDDNDSDCDLINDLNDFNTNNLLCNATQVLHFRTELQSLQSLLPSPPPPPLLSLHQPNPKISVDLDRFWQNGIPCYTKAELRSRVSTYDRAGTSRLMPGGKRFGKKRTTEDQQDSDSN